MTARRLDDDELQRMLPLPEAVFHILVALADHDRHGYALMQEVATLTDGRMRLRPGTLYAAIQRMLEQGFIVEVSSRGGDERRRTYRTTPLGRQLAIAETERLQALLGKARLAGFASRRA
jgi:DNA-binding PadR family transcriptional regulator